MESSYGPGCVGQYSSWTDILNIQPGNNSFQETIDQSMLNCKNCQESGLKSSWEPVAKLEKLCSQVLSSQS